MSEIDLKDLNLGQELAVSEIQSISDRNSIRDDRTKFDHFPPFPPSAALHKSTNPNYRMSENVAYRRPQSIIVDTSRGSLRDESEASSAHSGRGRLLRVGEGQAFDCKCCAGQQGCPFCQDMRIIKGSSNIIKFFEYVIAFKMGAAQSYGQKRLVSTASRQSVNQFCSDFFNKSEVNSQYSDLNRTERFSTRSKKCAKSDLGKQLTSSIPQVHENYCCDVCKTTPIIGNRYHCSECEDYDECEECHIKVGHRHLMEKIEKGGRARQMESLVHMLRQPLGRTSLKAPPVIKKSIDTYTVTTRSALR